MEESVRETLGEAYDLLADVAEDISDIKTYDKIKRVLNQINDELYKHL